MRIRSSPGFSIIEVVMVIGIIAIVFGLGLSFSLSIYQSQMLNAERDNLAVILGRARSEALSNLNESDHGVYIGSDNYVIFQGDTYASRNAAGDEIFPRTGGLIISGLSEVNFRSLDARVAGPGTVTLTNGIRTVAVSVNGEGMIDW